MSGYSPQPQVMLRCSNEWSKAKGIEFLNIEEDFYGRDVVTFVCPECGLEHKSLVVLR